MILQDRFLGRGVSSLGGLPCKDDRRSLMVLSMGNTGVFYGILPVVELGVFIVGIAGGLRFDGYRKRGYITCQTR